MFLFQKRQKSLRPKPSTPTKYPSGTCVVTELGRFYISNDYRHKIPTDRIFESWSFPLVVETTEAALAKYPILKSLGFRDGTLIKDISTGKMYVISKSLRRLIADPDVLSRLDRDESQVLLASQKEVLLHKEGEVFN